MSRACTLSCTPLTLASLSRHLGSAPPVPSALLQAPSHIASPSTRPSPLLQVSPTPIHAQAQPSQMGARPPYPSFVPGSGLRPQRRAPPTPGGPLRVYVPPRQIPDGKTGGVTGRPNGASALTSVSASTSSVRLDPSHGGESSAGVPPAPQPVRGWYDGYYMQPHVVGTPDQQPQGPQGPSRPRIPIPSRNAPRQLHAPDTPTIAPTVTGHPPHPAPSPHTYEFSLSSVSSPSPTASSIGPSNRLAKERAEEEAAEKAERAAEERAKQKADKKAWKEKEAEEKRKTEEEERTRKEKEKEEQQRRRKQEEAEKARKEAEKAKKETERLRMEIRERLRKEKVAATRAESEKGEVDESEATPASEAQAEETAEIQYSKDEPQDTGSLRIDTAVSDVPKKRHPGPLESSSTRKQGQPIPSAPAIVTARITEDLGSVSYPESIKSPEVELNVNVKRGKTRYDRDRLMEFMKICKDRPDYLPPLDAIALESSEQGADVSISHESQQHSLTPMVLPPLNSPCQLQNLGSSNFDGAGGHLIIHVSLRRLGMYCV
ncbi:uncharacterized protein C8Q71DRAFT_160311 [Rhodofomes roseus]|uniref:Eukaryotic translation initiation factor 4G1 eIF4E-binding domain-containing protein n=1 Tax=Rhodofomes roseus TaxID=34475 RepID=A0ABQ8KA04_9APHY|nr:uncharacterized protein C8Q71DRAFT_160311 [Rhodofomes roseus]KAH9834098.1 hypothetical protein C8Q71DRAFT_160311 [Rhodofomes roseus]